MQMFKQEQNLCAVVEISTLLFNEQMFDAFTEHRNNIAPGLG